MLQAESPSYPHTLAQWTYLVLAAFLLYGGGIVTSIIRRKREPAEVAKIQAETRSIIIASDVAVGQLALQAVAKAERLLEERNHWERYTTSLQLELDGKNQELAQLQFDLAQEGTRLKLAWHQLKKQKALLDFHGISYSELDKPKD